MPASDPPLDWPAYRSTALRAPALPPVPLPPGRTELTGPVFGEGTVRPSDADLTRQHAGEPQGERIVVHGQVLDTDGRPAPLDPNFTGAGRCLTDAGGRYRFVTVRPGAYPWKNSHNAWRPAHIHFSLIGRAFVQRLVTQMYFPGDPLFAQDAIALAVPEPARD